VTTSTDNSAREPSAATVEQLRRVYESFNARDIAAVLAELADDVIWPNGWEGGVLHGKDAVREYWRRQWSEIDPRVEPLDFGTREPDVVAVTVSQTVRSVDGILVSEGIVLHVYSFVGSLISEMAIEPYEE
jgi:ketosteroid isomerase-like protein